MTSQNQNQEKMVNGQRYTFYHINVMKLHELTVKLSKIVGPGLFSAFKGDVKNMMEQNIDMSTLIGEAFDRIEVSESEKIIRDVLAETTHAGDGRLCDNFDIHFNKLGLKHLYKVFVEACKVYFKDFFPKGSGEPSTPVSK